MASRGFKQVKDLVEAEGLEVVASVSNKHLKVWVRPRLSESAPRLVVAANTPSDHRALLNLRSELRRIKRTYEEV